MARRASAKKKAGKGHPVNLLVPGITLSPMGDGRSRILCEACSAQEDIGAGLPIFEPTRQHLFNASVEAFLVNHKPCFEKEGN